MLLQSADLCCQDAAAAAAVAVVALLPDAAVADVHCACVVVLTDEQEQDLSVEHADDAAFWQLII